MVKIICFIIIIVCTCAIVISTFCSDAIIERFEKKKARIEKDLEKDRERFNK